MTPKRTMPAYIKGLEMDLLEAKAKIALLKHLGNELKACAMSVGTTGCQLAGMIERSEKAVKEWEKSMV